MPHTCNPGHFRDPFWVTTNAAVKHCDGIRQSIAHRQQRENDAKILRCGKNTYSRNDFTVVLATIFLDDLFNGVTV